MLLRITFFFGLIFTFSVSAQEAVKVKVDSVKIDTSLVPVMSFDVKTVDLGKVKLGERPEIVYNFVNTGKKDLDILIVTACDCIVLDWTRTTVKVGDKGFVKVIFKSDEIEEEDLAKPLKKTVDIILKQTDPILDYPIVEVLDFKVFITE